ncbi:MAG: hypothetical protein WCK54_18340 [Desulfuromonadales bacterium]
MKTNQRLDAIEKHINSSRKAPDTRTRVELNQAITAMSDEEVQLLEEPIRSMVAAIRKCATINQQEEAGSNG